ncbi:MULTISPECIES: Co2+/Mg2+ efflux protein ApaG [Pseudomonas]|jgi:ApaG protein|uniref:Protein ApaG n=1 Tax=Pseudomonas frederiksbergensis TaxID=104087 RepID=A0A0B1Z7Y1_9PSED|nr:MULTISPECIES: Co2+/Mg2+ efflux protein ApaG [Pseudomonas]KHK65321.1 magnesium transporter ApaG [Pseudomonas frederiksbergensis]KJH81733.1 magnesium transporter ApaG [Pseudomonas fluorescens]MBI6619903.1 Co2+/Mg2+ efflux protein ApaG [Pseudomonas corrugata]MBI6692720.1 Co2+/Mg2+ efflux protein ApaG [Pseudomonas corrugata]WRV67921.1 Co2+/Mg2+ efflux protein ApaG [Pseudomonas frederiksbergensis]
MSDPRYQVDVSVATRFLAEQSQPEHNRFAFAYTITVRNNGSLPARLLSRHWVITDGDGHVEEVRGEGVVGQQPLIDAGKSHSYSSGTVMTTKVGTMQGTYQMLAEDGKRFDAIIKPFRLAVPGALH